MSNQSFQIKGLQILICIFCLVLIIPFIYLSIYNVPGASDDFFHGKFMRDKNYLDAVWYWYVNGYNSRFANAFFMLWPNRPFLKFSFGMVFPMLSFVTLFFAFLSFLRAILPSQKVIVQVVFSFVFFTLFIAYVPEVRQLYWYSGFTVYILPAILYLFLMNLLLRKFNKKFNKWELIVIGVLLFVIIGSHENWMIIGGLTIYFLFINAVLRREKVTNQTVFILILNTLLIGMVLFAPGVTNRLSGEGDTTQNAVFFDSFYYSFFHLGNYGYKWFYSSGMLLACFCVMLLSKKDTIKIIQTPLSTILTFLLIFVVVYSGFFVLIYSLGATHDLRMRGVVPNFSAGLLLLILMFYLLGQTKLASFFKERISEIGMYFILLLSVIICVSNSSNFRSVSNDLLSGKAEEQAINSRWLINLVKDANVKEIIVPQQTVDCEALYSVKFPNKQEDFLFWIMKDYFKKRVFADDKSIEYYKETHTLTEGKLQNLIYKQRPWGDAYSFKSKKVSNRFVEISSDIINTNVKVKTFFLVFQNDAFSKRIDVSEHKNGDKFKYRFNVPKFKSSKKVKIFFANNTSDTLVVENLQCKIRSK